MANYNPTPEQLGRRRFPDNKAFRKNLAASSRGILNQINQGLLPSNYPKDLSTTFNIHNRLFAREIARLNLSMQAINADKTYTQTRARYLQQILGERLFLGKKIAPTGYSDESYREYVTAIKSANLKGSKKTSIEELASFFTKQNVHIKELYATARAPYSSLGVSDTHKMIVQVFIENLQAGQNVNVLKENLDFFINLVRPAHVLYDTELIWTETFDINKTVDLIFGDTGGGCVPAYDYLEGRTALYAQQVFVQDTPENATGFIEAIHHLDLMFYLNDATKVITEPGLEGTQFFSAAGKQVTFSDLRIGQYVRINYLTIPGAFQFWNYPSEILTTPNSQYYKAIFRLPLFQETVKKLMDPKGRFPLQIRTTETTLCDRWVQDALQPMYEDLRSNCDKGASYAKSTSEMLRKHHGFPEFYWPYPSYTVHDPVLLGSDFVQIMPYKPLTDGASGPATPTDITMTFDGTSTSGAITSVDASNGRIYLNDTTTYWETAFGRYPINGDLFKFSYHYLQGNTNYDATTQTVFGVSYWQLPKIPLVKNDGLGTLAEISDVTVSVDGTTVTGAITAIDPLMGHVTLSPYAFYWASSELGRIPVAEQILNDGTVVSGDVFKFNYYYGDRYKYAMILDDPARYMDEMDYMLDGSSSTLPMTADDPAVIGYRYRAQFLQHSSVLNSPDTLVFNGYQKPANRASIINHQPAWNQFNTVFSPEFLTDPQIPELNEAYLENGLDPVLKLNKGTPPFQKTFSYQPGLIYQKKLQDIRRNHKLLLYSDMVIKEFETGNDEVNLSSICDSKSVSFKIRFDPEYLLPIRECSPWILFDTVTTNSVKVEIPGYTQGVPNLRVSNKHLRENLILREVEPTGTAKFTYSFITPMDSTAATTYQLPANFKYFYNDTWIDFPALPIVNEDSGTPIINVDITCTVNGQSHSITALDATTGLVQIAPFTLVEVIEKEFTLTQENIDAKFLEIPGVPEDPTQVTVTVIHGTSQFIYSDFKMLGHFLTWYFSDLANAFIVGDKIRVSYVVNPNIGVPVTFTYSILNGRYIDVVDDELSRIMDYKYVFGGLCPDIESVNLGVMFNEYYGFLDDDSDGIKLKFFNKDTLALEEHIFSGPVFETYDITQDELGSPDNFSNALVRINNPLSNSNPLNYSADYGYLNDSLVRFRKKTYQELMPNRTFRTLKLVEMLPV